MPWPQAGAPQYHAQLWLPDKGRAIKGLVVCNNWALEPFDQLNGLALGHYQPSPEVLIIYKDVIVVSLILEMNHKQFFYENMYLGAYFSKGLKSPARLGLGQNRGKKS